MCEGSERRIRNSCAIEYRHKDYRGTRCFPSNLDRLIWREKVIKFIILPTVLPSKEMVLLSHFFSLPNDFSLLSLVGNTTLIATIFSSYSLHIFVCTHTGNLQMFEPFVFCISIQFLASSFSYPNLNILYIRVLLAYQVLALDKYIDRDTFNLSILWINII